MDTETTDEIVAATHRALAEHGYADLTVERIAAESSVSSAAIHYHYDTKRELLEAFLGHLVDGFEERLASESDHPCDRLTAFVEAVFDPAEGDRGDDFPVALMELKAQAPYHDPYRERFRRLDDRMRAVVADAVRDGIDAGRFDEADPEATARAVVTVVNGAHVRGVALGEEPAESRRVVEAILRDRLGWTPATDDGTGGDPDRDRDPDADSSEVPA